MPVDSNIALAFRAPQIESPVNMMAQMQQLQGGRQANELRAMQMDEMRADRQQQNALSQFMQGYQPGVTDDRQALAYGRGGREAFTALSTATRDRATADRQTEELRLKKIEAQQGAFGRALLLARDNPSDDGLISAARMVSAQGLDVTAQVEQLLAMPFEQRRSAINNIVNTDPQSRAAVEFVSPKWEERSDGARKFYVDNNPRSPTFNKTRGDMPLSATPGETLQATTSRANNAATNATTRRGQDMVDARAAANAPGELLRTRAAQLAQDPEHQQRLAEARATGTAAGKDAVVARTALPTAIQQGKSMLDNIDGMIGKAPGPDGKGGTAPHPGFSTAVGATIFPGARFVPGTDTASFMSRLEQVQGGAFLQAFETLKGGGAISETEGTKATQAITRMSIAQNEAEFRTAAREFQKILRDAVQNSERRLAQVSGAGAAGAGASGGWEVVR